MSTEQEKKNLTERMDDIASLVITLYADHNVLKRKVAALEELLNKNCSDFLKLEKRIEELERKNN